MYRRAAKSCELAAMSSFREMPRLEGRSLAEVRAMLGDWMATAPGHAEREAWALAIFRWQAAQSGTYGTFVRNLGVTPGDVQSLEAVPCMPVEVFKHQHVQAGHWPVAHTFRSSGTSQTVHRAQHHLDGDGLSWYARVARSAWSHVWEQPVEAFDWLAMLPGYTGREDASLLAMVQDFMAGPSRMLMDDPKTLNGELAEWLEGGTHSRLVLVGVTWALLDWLAGPHAPSEQLCSHPRLAQVVLLETGGMKGRAVEPLKEDVHKAYRDGLSGIQVASEYGMTEMLSQGYALDGVHHRFPPWVFPLVRDPRDPRSAVAAGRSGRLDVVDLANLHSCAFLATSDQARHGEAGLVLEGRVDHADIRGCSLLANG